MRLLFISDLHANMEALNAVMENVRYDRVFCLGDLVDYGPNPLECIDWIRDNNVLTIRGNHDNAVAFHVDCGCSYVYKHLSETTREYAWKHIRDNDEKFLRRLPLKHELEVDGFKIMLAHGSPASFFDYIYPDISGEKLNEYTAGVNADFLVVGHTHKPVVLKSPGITVLNSGSVGQPRDNDWRASCMAFDTDRGIPEILRLDYDIEATCRKIRSSMPHADELIAILKRGY